MKRLSPIRSKLVLIFKNAQNLSKFGTEDISKVLIVLFFGPFGENDITMTSSGRSQNFGHHF